MYYTCEIWLLEMFKQSLLADIYHHKPVVHFLIWQEIMKYMYNVSICLQKLFVTNYFPTRQKLHVKLLVYSTCILSLSLSLSFCWRIKDMHLMQYWNIWLLLGEGTLKLWTTPLNMTVWRILLRRYIYIHVMVHQKIWVKEML